MKNNKKLSAVFAFILAVTMISGCDSSSDSKLEATDNSSEIITQVNANAEIPTDEEIFEMFENAKKMSISSGIFTRTDGGLYEKRTNETIEQFVGRYRTVFTDEFVNRRFDLIGIVLQYDDVTVMSLERPAAEYVWFDYQERYVYFEDITDESNYEGYDSVIIGGYGNRGSDITYFSNQLEITEKSQNKITIKNTIQHYYYDSPEPIYVCHIENGRRVIDGTYGGFDEETKLPIIADDSRKGEVLPPNEHTEAWVTTAYEYNLILDDGKWKFDNFVLWG